MRLQATLFAAVLATSSAAFAQADNEQEHSAQELTPPPLVDAPPPAPAPMRPATRPVPIDELQTIAGRTNRITFGPLTTFLLSASGEFEHAVSNKVSFFVGPRLGVGPLQNTVTSFSMGVSAGLRFFPGTAVPAPGGAWVGPELWTEYYSESGTSSRDFHALQRYTVMGLAMVGYTWIWPSGFTMSMGGGLGGGVVSTSGTKLELGRVVTADSSEFRPTLGLQWNLGYAF